MTLAVDLEVFVPYAHGSVAEARPLAGALAPRARWSRRDLVRLTRRFAEGAAAELHQAARFDPVERWYLRLAATEQVEVYLMTWTPGQHTRPHGHAGAGAYTVLYGELTETWQDGRRRGTTVRAAGEAAAVSDGVHTLDNLGTLGAISVHAYAPPLSVAAGPCSG